MATDFSLLCYVTSLQSQTLVITERGTSLRIIFCAHPLSYYWAGTSKNTNKIILYAALDAAGAIDPPAVNSAATPSEAASEQDPHAVQLVDAANGFNELSQKAMCWTVRHLWSTGARFSFNCYRHSAQLIVRRKNCAACEILHSKEGVTQGDPLLMVLYGLALVPLAESLRIAVPKVV